MTALFDPTSITYRSSASETDTSFNINQSAQSSVDVDAEDLPSCVQRLSYVPEGSATSCLVSVTCKSEIADNLPENCSADGNTASCYSDEQSCREMDSWLQEAENICGC